MIDTIIILNLYIVAYFNSIIYKYISVYFTIVTYFTFI